MTDSEKGAIPVAQSRGRVVTKQRGEYLLFQCLIVSTDVERQELFARAAAEAGWDVTIAGDAEMAFAHHRRSFMQLALIDLESDSSGGLHELIERLSPTKDLLTVACGAEADMDEEIWVRQLGVWLYLPGACEETQLSIVCGEARHIVERLHAAAASATSLKGSRRKAL